MPRTYKSKKKRSLRRVARTAILLGAFIILFVEVIVLAGLFFFPTLSSYKREMDHEGAYATELIGKEYLEDIFDRTRNVYYSTPEKIRSERFSDEYIERILPIIDDEGEFGQARRVLIKCREQSEMNNVYYTFYDREDRRLVYVIDGNVSDKAYLPGQWISNETGMVDSQDTIERTAASDWYMPVTYGKANGFEATDYITIYAEDGEFIGYMTINVSINDVVRQLLLFLAIYFPVMALVMAFLAYKTNKIVEARIIDPINKLAEGTRDYAAFGTRGDGSETDIFEGIKIETHDEIEELLDTMVEMEDQINEAMKTIRESAAKEERIAAELDLARDIQLAALPQAENSLPADKRNELYATMHPAKEVGGDFYDFFMIDKDHLAIIIADVSGKGVPAALFMMVSKALLKNMALRGGKPSETLKTLNDTLCADDLNDMFVTIWMGILDITTGEITAANAGHEYPFILDESGNYTLFKDPHGLVVGALPSVKYIDYSFTLPKGGRLFVYTDGVAEAENDKETLFGTDRLMEVLNRYKDNEPKNLVGNIKKEVDSFANGMDQFDDITMLSLWYKG